MKTCPFGGKVSYASEQKAKAARETIDKYGGDAKGLRVYKCPACYNFHFTRRKD